MKHRQKSGYILILVLMLTSLSVVLVSYIYNKGFGVIPFSYGTIQREKAKMLALSGIQIALSQFAQEIEIPKTETQPQAPPTKANQQTPQQNPQDEASKKFLETILPLLNSWQTFALKEEVDGIDGEIKICITSEDGKLDINQIFDFNKHEFKNASFIAEFFKEGFKNVGKEDLFSEFEKFLKERHYKLDDPTELLLIKGFEVFRHSLFYEPKERIEKKEGTKTKGPLYLADIFTVWSGKTTVDPWLLSPSMSTIFGLQRIDLGTELDNKKKLAKQWVKDFKSENNWQQDWNKILSPVYGVDFNSLAKGFDSLLSTKFDPRIFSVLSYGKVGDITQRILAIVERVIKQEESTFSPQVKIKKLYWL
jgi:hypothetical protein